MKQTPPTLSPSPSLAITFPSWEVVQDVEGLIELGRLHEPWGVHGGLHVHPHQADSTALVRAKQWVLQPAPLRASQWPFSGAVLAPIIQLHQRPNGWVVQLQGLTDRDAAVALKGATIWLHRRQFPKLPKGEYYWVDLIGLQVINRQNEPMGIIHDLMTTGPQTVLVITPPPETQGLSERLIPFVDAYVDRVDLAAGCVIVDWSSDYDLS